MKTSLRTWLRGAFVFAVATAALALPATSSAMAPSIREAHVSAWAGTSAPTITLTFTAHRDIFGNRDKISGFSMSDTTNFSVTQTNCALNTNPSNCTITVTFNAPAVPAQPLYVADLNLMSSWNGTEYDGAVRFYAIAGVKGVDGEQGPGCVVTSDAPTEELPNDETTGDAPAIVTETPAFPECKQGEQGETGAPGANGTNGTNGTNGAAGATGATGATGAAGATGAQGPAGTDGAPAPQAAQLVVSKVVTVRTSCFVKRNRLKQRVAFCLVKTPKNTPASTWTMFAGGTRIGTGSVKAGVREIRISKVLSKTVGGWITVTVKKK